VVVVVVPLLSVPVVVEPSVAMAPGLDMVSPPVDGVEAIGGLDCIDPSGIDPPGMLPPGIVPPGLVPPPGMVVWANTGAAASRAADAMMTKRMETSSPNG
jgi:hypothetical protein